MIDRNLKNLIPGRAGETLFRTLEDMDRKMTQMATELAAFKADVSQSQVQTSQQLSNVTAGLVGARAQAVIGQEHADPSLPGAVGGGTVTDFSAGDLSPLFTTQETNTKTTPTLAFSQIAQNANIVFAGPASGAPANPTFRALVAADFPVSVAQSTNSKVTAGAPFINDGKIDVTINGVVVSLMTTA